MKKILIPLSIFLATGIIFFGINLFIIYTGVKSTCLQAKEEFRKDCVGSLTGYVKSENHTLREKNRAVWALGQLADKKYLPFLEELKQSLPDQKNCDHENNLCLYEIEKAIKWCTKGNSTSWMYKKGIQ